MAAPTTDLPHQSRCLGSSARRFREYFDQKIQGLAMSDHTGRLAWHSMSIPMNENTAHSCRIDYFCRQLSFGVCSKNPTDVSWLSGISDYTNPVSTDRDALFN